jgi:hypothetical protein
MTMQNNKRRWAAAVLAALAAAVVPAFAAGAQLPDGKKTITLISAAGDTQTIGAAIFTNDGDGRTFTITLDGPEFEDEFLSMRPFRCLKGVKETWCHVDYPYELKRRVTKDDLMDLEYALLFLFKPPAGYGISTWNGLYFKLAADVDGVISGTVHDVNLEPLGVPADDPKVRLIQAGDLSPADPETHRFARIEIR